MGVFVGGLLLSGAEARGLEAQALLTVRSSSLLARKAVRERQGWSAAKAEWGCVRLLDLS